MVMRLGNTWESPFDPVLKHPVLPLVRRECSQGVIDMHSSLRRKRLQVRFLVGVPLSATAVVRMRRWCKASGFLLFLSPVRSAFTGGWVSSFTSRRTPHFPSS